MKQTATLLTLTALLLTAGQVSAQDGDTGRTAEPPRVEGTGRAETPAGGLEVKGNVGVTGDPADPEVDRRMLRALREEYEGDGSGAPPPVNEPYDAPPYDDTIIIDTDPEPDWVRFRIEVSFWATTLGQTDLTTRRGDLRSKFDATDDGIGDYESKGSPLIKAEVGFHPVVSLTGLFHSSTFKSEETLNRNILFADRGFAEGTMLESEITVTAGEGHLSIHALRLDWLRLDLMLGVRYQKTTVEFENKGDGLGPERKRFELVTPMVGIGFAVKPWSWLEFYGEAHVGGIEYDASDDDDGRISEFDERTLSVATLDAGVRLGYQNCFGVVLGIRVEAYEQELFTGRNMDDVIESAIGGPYAGLFFGF